MRKSRQPGCTAAISTAAIANTPKLLERYRNPSCAILFESSSAPVAPMM